jgi:branched-chain amino acid transport system permease protein
MTPFLVFSLAALGLNILTGYAGQVSFGSAALMAVGAFASYNILLRLPFMPSMFAFVLAGLCAAAVGVLFGLPSLRIRGFYLAASTLATQFFILWCLTRVGWFTNNSASGVIAAQQVAPLGFTLDTPARKYVFVLIVVTVLAVLAKNLVRSNAGRCWMAIRDMDVAAEVIGVNQLRAKLTAFAVSSFYCGMAGALYAYAYIATVEPEAFSLDLSFKILFMIIIGGLGSILGSFIGAAFMILLPIGLNLAFEMLEKLSGIALPSGFSSHVEVVLFGVLIIFFLAVEPHGLARLWQIGKAKLRTWPFPH